MRSGGPDAGPGGDSDVDGVSRRGFLGAAGGAALLGDLPDELTAVVEGAARQTDSGLAVHDHSGPESGGARLRPSALASAETPVVNVSAHGVVGDGETDDSAPFQAAVDAATPRGVLYVPPDVDLYFESPVDVDLGANAGAYVPFSFVCDGTLRPAPGIGDAVTVHDGGYVYLDVRVAGGGAPDDVAVAVNQAHWSYVEGTAVGYGGTFIEMRNNPFAGQAWSIGTVQSVDCGRSLSVRNIGGVGQIDTVVDVNPRRMPLLDQPTDMSLNLYHCVAGAQTETGLTIDSPTSLWIDTIRVAGKPAFDNVTVLSPTYAHVGHVETTGGDRGLVVSGSKTAHLADVEAYGNRVGVALTPTSRTRVDLDAHDNAESGLVVSGSPSIGNWITGRVVDNGAPARVEVEFAPVHLADVVIAGNDGPAPGEDDIAVPGSGSVQLDLAENNDCRIYDAHVPAVSGEPHVFNGVATATDGATLSRPRGAGGPPDYLPGDTVAVEGDATYVRGLQGDWWPVEGSR